MWLRDSWLFRRAAPRRVLRIGRHRIECWSDSKAGWARQGEVPLPHAAPDTPPTLETLAPALQSSLQNMAEATQLTVILESFWMPVSLLSTGRKAWSPAQLDAMGQHRLRDIHGVATGAWRVQVHHTAGQEHALVFGCPAAVLDGIAHACAHQGVVLRSAQPAFAWAWNRHRLPWPQRGDGWWICLEQDRAVGCWVRRRGIEALHPALEPSGSAALMASHLAREALRSGVAEADPPITMMAWERVAGTPGMPESSRHRWLSLSQEPA